MFYTFDAVARFHAAQIPGADLDPRRFIAYAPLGEAILRTLPSTARAPFLLAANSVDWPEVPTRSVVLIDEIDKAPRDFPNDILGELERFWFPLPELGIHRVEADSSLSPIVIVTSNNERSLPDAFLRRCVYLHMNFPSVERQQEILLRRLASDDTSWPKSAKLARQAITLVQALRSDRLRLQKPPGLAELLSFVLALRGAEFGPDDELGVDTMWQRIALTTLIKTREDRDAVQVWLPTWSSPA